MKKLLAVLLVLSLCLGTASIALAREEEREPVSFEIMASVTPDFGDWENMWLFKEIERRFNVTFTINQVSSDGFEEKKALAFATNTLPNLFVGTSLNASELATYGAQGQLVPLNDYFTDEYMPNFMAQMAEHPEVYRALFFPDGNAYAVYGFTGNKRDFALSKFWVNIDWAQNLTGGIPETLDQFYDYLVAVRDNDCDGDGDATDEIPLGGIYNSQYGGYYDSLIPVLGAFGFTDRRLQTIDGKVYLVPTHENYKEFLKFMNKLYTEKLLDPEYFTQSEEQRVAKLAEANVAAYTDWAQWLYNTDEAVWQQWQAIDPLTSQWNDTKIFPAVDCSLTYIFAVTTGTEHIDRLLEVLDWFFTDEGGYMHWNGPEKGTWDENPDYGWVYEGDNEAGERIYTQYWPEDKYDTINAYLHDVVSPWSFPSGVASYKTASAGAGVTELNLSENIETHYVPYYVIGFPLTARYTQEEADELALITTDLDSYIDQMVSKMIIGELDIDETFDSFVQGCLDRGGTRYMEIYQGVYDRWANN